MDKVIFYISQSRAVEARLAHNQKVTGSNPVSAISIDKCKSYSLSLQFAGVRRGGKPKPA